MFRAKFFLPILLLMSLAVSAAENEKPDLRLYVIGNSLTDELSYDNFLEMAKAGGKEIALGSTRVPGAPIGWLLKHNLEKGGFTHKPYGNPKQAFTEYQWDAFTFQPFQWSFVKNIQHMPVFMDLLYENSPDCQVYIYAQWPRNDGGDWIDGWLAPREEDIMSREEYEDHVTWLRENDQEGKPAKLIPVGHAMYVMEQKIRAGLVPGLTSMWQAYGDEVHLNNLGHLFVASTYYATLFGEDPTPLPYEMFNGPEEKIPLTPEMAKIVRESVWQVVATHPMTGVTSDRAVEIVTPALDPAVADSAYRWKLLHAFGKAPYLWTLSAGKLPDGITLDKNGTLSGKPASVGTYDITATLTDGNGTTVTRAYSLTVNPDTAPVFTTESLPEFKQGEAYHIPLKAESVNPPFKWEVVSGELPKGMSLSRFGVLSGSPGNTGDFAITIKLTDGDSEEPESVEKDFTLTVKPGGDSVRFARKLAAEPKIDGQPDGDPWTFDEAVVKVVDGTPDVKVWLDYGWTDDALYVAVKVQDDILTGKKWKLESGDQVRLYFDGRNNREATYNWDDIILAANPKGGDEDQGNTFGSSVKCGRIDGGYLLEAKVPFRNLGHKISKKDNLTADWICVGLDVMVIDIDEENGTPKSRTVWVGSASNDDDPSQFQTLIMKP